MIENPLVGKTKNFLFEHIEADIFFGNKSAAEILNWQGWPSENPLLGKNRDGK